MVEQGEQKPSDVQRTLVPNNQRAKYGSVQICGLPSSEGPVDPTELIEALKTIKPHPNGKHPRTH